MNNACHYYRIMSNYVSSRHPSERRRVFFHVNAPVTGKMGLRRSVHKIASSRSHYKLINHIHRMKRVELQGGMRGSYRSGQIRWIIHKADCWLVPLVFSLLWASVHLVAINYSIYIVSIGGFKCILLLHCSSRNEKKLHLKLTDQVQSESRTSFYKKLESSIVGLLKLFQETRSFSQ